MWLSHTRQIFMNILREKKKLENKNKKLRIHSQKEEIISFKKNNFIFNKISRNLLKNKKTRYNKNCRQMNDLNNSYFSNFKISIIQKKKTGTNNSIIIVKIIIIIILLKITIIIITIHSSNSNKINKNKIQSKIKKKQFIIKTIKKRKVRVLVKSIN